MSKSRFHTSCESKIAIHNQLSQKCNFATSCGASTRCSKVSTEISCQPIPETGALADNLNSNRDALVTRVGAEKAIVYCYVISTIKNHNEYFCQTGSAPNFQGNLITLCTCKRYMRTFMKPEEWIGKWIAGFSGVAAGNGCNTIVYLMKVGHAFDSHQSFWLSREIPEETKQVKSADGNKFGDVYRPKEPLGDPYDPKSYRPPTKAHVHFANKEWHRDINYRFRDRKDALLVGNSIYSFLWNKPMLLYKNGRIHRGQKKMYLSTLLDQLEEVGE